LKRVSLKRKNLKKNSRKIKLTSASLKIALLLLLVVVVEEEFDDISEKKSNIESIVY
jgi:hypothetical protein